MIGALAPEAVNIIERTVEAMVANRDDWLAAPAASRGPTGPLFRYDLHGDRTRGAGSWK